MADERKKEIYRLLKEESIEQIKELEALEQRVQEQREIVKSTYVQLTFYRKYLDNNREKHTGQIPLNIKESVITVKNPKIYGGGDSIPNINDFKVLGDRVIHLLKYSIRRATPRYIIEAGYKEVLNLSETRSLKYAIRNKVKHGNLLLVKFNNSRRYSFAILPEWLDENKHFKKEHWPLPEYLPNKVSKIRILRIKKGLL